MNGLEKLLNPGGLGCVEIWPWGRSVLRHLLPMLLLAMRTISQLAPLRVQPAMLPQPRMLPIMPPMPPTTPLLPPKLQTSPGNVGGSISTFQNAFGH